MWHGYVALFQGAIFNPHTASKGTLGRLRRTDLRDADQRDAPDPGRPVGRAWRSGPACSTSVVRARSSWARSAPGSSGFHWHLAPGLHLLLAILAGMARRRRLGRPGRPAQGQDRRPRGDHHDHAQLHRGLLPGLPAVGRGLPGAAVRPGDLQPRLRERPAAAPARRQRPRPRRPDPRGARRGARRLADRQEHAGLPAASGRGQPVRRADRRHERREQLHRGDADRRGAVRPGRRQPDPGHQQPADRRHRRRASGSTRSRSPCSGGPTPRASSRPACSSARSTPAARRCSRPPGRRSTWCR